MGKVIFWTLSTIAFISVAACSGGKSRKLTRGHCFNPKQKDGSVKKYDPIPVVLDVTKSKTHSLMKFEGLEGNESKEEKVGKLESGEFEYVYSEFFYEKNLRDPELHNPYQRIHFTHQVTSAGKDLFKTKCVSHMPGGGKIAAISADLITGFDVNGKALETTKTGQIVTEFKENKLFREFVKTDDNKKFSSPKEFMNDLDVGYRLYSVSGQRGYNYELRMAHNFDLDSTVYMVVRYKFTDSKTLAANKKEEESSQP